MRSRLDNFKKYILGLRGDNEKTIIIAVLNCVKLEQAGQEEQELLQYGMFFDGEHLFYDETKLPDDEQEFNEALLNHILHFMFGAHFSMSLNPSNKALEKFGSIVCIMFSRMGISRIIARYAQSKRTEQWKTRYASDPHIYFAPHPKTSKYFYDHYYAGDIALPPNFYLDDSKLEDMYDGKVGLIRYATCHVTKGGMGFIWPENTIYLLKHEDGKLERVSGLSKDGRELGDMKRMADKLASF